MRLKDKLTFIVCSQKPYNFTKEFDGFTCINPLQTISCLHELHLVQCDVILNQVKTEYYIVHDDDDPFPTIPNFEIEKDVGIVYGENITIKDGVEARHMNRKWREQTHRNFPNVVHKAICHTEYSKEILRPVIDEDILTHWWLHYHLMKDYNHQYVQGLDIPWVENIGIVSKMTNIPIENTRKLLHKRYG